MMRRTILFAITSLAPLAAGLISCAGESTSQEGDTWSDTNDEVTASNGLSRNGLSRNGLSRNGLSRNGLSRNGLTDADFIDWYNNQDGAAACAAASGCAAMADHDAAMRYLTKCALPAGSSLSFTDRFGNTHTWNGVLGLAPGFASGAPTADEKKWISACLLAHVNYREGASVPLSIRGLSPALAVTDVEQAAFSMAESSYFGDLFASTPRMYVCRHYTSPYTDLTESKIMADWGRNCSDLDETCGVMTYLDSCSSYCTGTPGAYSSCTVNGTTYNRVVSAYFPRVVQLGSRLFQDGSSGSIDRWSMRYTYAGGAYDYNGSTASDLYLLDLSRSTRARLDVDFTVSAAGDYGIELRYRACNPADGEAPGTRYLDVYLNNTRIYDDLAFTASDCDWHRMTLPGTVSLRTGTLANRLSFAHAGTGIPPRLDYFVTKL